MYNPNCNVDLAFDPFVYQVYRRVRQLKAASPPTAILIYDRDGILKTLTVASMIHNSTPPSTLIPASHRKNTYNPSPLTLNLKPNLTPNANPNIYDP